MVMACEVMVVATFVMVMFPACGLSTNVCTPAREVIAVSVCEVTTPLELIASAQELVALPQEPAVTPLSGN